MDSNYSNNPNPFKDTPGLQTSSSKAPTANFTTISRGATNYGIISHVNPQKGAFTSYMGTVDNVTATQQTIELELITKGNTSKVFTIYTRGISYDDFCDCLLFQVTKQPLEDAFDVNQLVGHQVKIITQTTINGDREFENIKMIDLH